MKKINRQVVQIIIVILFLTVGFDSISQIKGSYTDYRDGKVYKTVIIADNIWMAENLSFSEQGSCFYNEDKKDSYGKLYTWKAAQNVCPIKDGWRLPTKDEWFFLLQNSGGYLGMNDPAFLFLSKDGKSGFNVKLGGYYDIDKGYIGKGIKGWYWTATPYSEEKKEAYFVYFYEPSNNSDYRSETNVKNMLSVRCIKDK